MTTTLVTLTLIAAGLIVVALAVVLITILVLLRKTLFTLGTVNVGLRSIARRVEPLQPVLADLNTELAGVQREMSTALAERRAPSGV
ncbi:hypothetical protein [Haloechinothrix salitolerans]|uniref:DUF948 domain-containing protein n=1 Tax=Haloechinothrix salitolerans TaxID=926830 RepID=A0ABW2C1U6_9PSEU